MHSDYYGEDADYTRKGGVIHSEILLPEHAPPEYADRETLWNSVEKFEKNKRAQLAYNFDIALQNEFTMEENLSIVRQFLQEEFVSRGMIADYAIHAPDKDNGIPNPHFHVLCPMRPLNTDGSWGPKQRREYQLDENGNRLRDSSGQYIFDAVPTTDWGTPEMLEHWRQAWAGLCNQKFAEKNLSCQIDHRSYSRQGSDQLPTIHEGPTVRSMEAKGISTDKGELNHWIRSTNSMLRTMKGHLKKLLEWIASVKTILGQAKEPSLGALLSEYYTQRNFGAYSNKAKIANTRQMMEFYNLLKQANVCTFSDLEQRISDNYDESQALKADTKLKSGRMKEINMVFRYCRTVQDLKPIADKLGTIHFKKSKEKYKAEHSTELRQYYAARRYLDNAYPDKKIPTSALKKEYAALEQACSNNSSRIRALWDENKQWLSLKGKLDQVLPKEHKRTDREFQR